MIKNFSNFLTSLSRINNLGKKNPVQWHFHTGMLFLAKDKWWGDFKLRNNAHEGIDITYYTTTALKLQQFDQTTLVPAMKSGTVLNICDDFLGKTIVTQPFWTADNPGRRILLIYSHINPHNSISKGSIVTKKNPIATVSPTVKNPLLPPHLHLSCIEVPENIPAGKLNWDLFSKRKNIRLIHPLFL